MAQYIHHTDNVIDRGPGSLPKATAHTSGYDLLADSAEGRARLKEDGWLPVAGSAPPHDAATKVVTGPTGVQVGDPVSPGAASVRGVWRVKPKPTPPTAADQMEQEIRDRPFARALVAALAELRGRPEAETVNWLKSKL